MANPEAVRRLCAHLCRARLIHCLIFDEDKVDHAQRLLDAGGWDYMAMACENGVTLFTDVLTLHLRSLGASKRVESGPGKVAADVIGELLRKYPDAISLSPGWQRVADGAGDRAG